MSLRVTPGGVIVTRLAREVIVRPVSLAIVALVAGFIAEPSWAQDMVYRHQHDGPSLLEGSDGRAYWVLMAECSGFYGALSNRAPDPASSQAYLDEGIAWLRLAASRVQSDRSLNHDQAIDLIDPYVQRARLLGESTVVTPTTAVTARDLTPEMVMTSTCGSLRRVYRAASGA